MTSTEATLHHDGLKSLQSGVSSLGDDQLKRIVAMVDGLADRGAMDVLLVPLRKRLATLRPVRKPTLHRLLFVPIEPLIVPPDVWQRGELSIVRSSLAPLVKLVLQGLGDEVGRLRKRIDDCSPDDETSLLAIGAKLWPAAAAILRNAKQPPNWSASGLLVGDFRPMSHDISTLLGHALEIETMVRQARLTGRLRESAVVDLLTNVVRSGGSGFGLMSVLLMARLPQISVALRAVRRVAETSQDMRLNTVADFVLDHGLGCIQGAADEVIKPDVSLGAVAEGLERLHIQLADVEQSPQAQRTDRRRRIGGLRRHIEEAARTRFAGTLENEVLEPLRHATAGVGATVEPEKLEATVRALRRLGEAGGSFGDAKAYNEMLQSAVGVVSAIPDSTGLTLTDRVRLVELLLDSDAAMELLQSNATAAS